MRYGSADKNQVVSEPLHVHLFHNIVDEGVNCLVGDSN